MASGAVTVFGLDDHYIILLLSIGIWAWAVVCLYAAGRLLRKVEKLNQSNLDLAASRYSYELRLESAHRVIRWLADGLEPMDRDAQDEYLEATGRDPLA